MLKQFALAGFAIAVAASAQAMPRAPLQADSLITQVRQGCGAGMMMVGGQCIHRINRRAYALGTAAANNSGNCYRGWDQDARQYKYMPCSAGEPAYVDTPGVHVIMRARERMGEGMWYPYATSSGITCMPGTTITMGGQEHLCQ